MAGYSVTSINMKHGDEFSDTDDTLRYFAGGPRSAWTGKVRQTNSIPSLSFQHCMRACLYLPCCLSGLRAVVVSWATPTTR